MPINLKAGNCQNQSICSKDQFSFVKMFTFLVYWSIMVHINVRTWSKVTYLFWRRWLKYLATTWGQVMSSHPKNCMVVSTGRGWSSDGAVLGMSTASKVKSRFKRRKTYDEKLLKTFSPPKIISIGIKKWVLHNTMSHLETEKLRLNSIHIVKEISVATMEVSKDGPRTIPQHYCYASLMAPANCKFWTSCFQCHLLTHKPILKTISGICSSPIRLIYLPPATEGEFTLILDTAHSILLNPGLLQRL